MMATSGLLTAIHYRDFGARLCSWPLGEANDAIPDPQSAGNVDNSSPFPT